MSVDYYKIFPTTIGRYWYNENERVKQSVIPLLESTPERSEHGNSTHYFERNLDALAQREFIELQNFILNCVDQYAKNICKISTAFIPAGSWVNKTNKGFSQKIHNHGNSYLSATYYIQYDSNLHSAINFYNNKEQEAKLPYMYFKPTEFNEYNALGFSLNDLKEGDLLIWPSYLEHGYDENNGDNRISLSMNFLPEYINNGSYPLKIIKP
jgi:uncharacterized protein (TIGR02466 family)